MDTLDYTSGKVNEGSKAIMLGLGDPIRELPREFHGELPREVVGAEVFCPGCLVLQGVPYERDPEQAARLAGEPVFADWPLIVLHDEVQVAHSTTDFLWATWTRFEPAGDIHAAHVKVERHHLFYRGPIVIDARTKPGFPAELIVRDDIRELADRRWREYFPTGLHNRDMKAGLESEPVFPISVRWDSGEVDSFESVESIETDLEVFDSEKTPECEVTDVLGRRVRLRVNDRLELEEFSLV